MNFIRILPSIFLVLFTVLSEIRFIQAQSVSISKDAEWFEFRQRNSKDSFSYVIAPVTDDSLELYRTRPVMMMKNTGKWRVGFFSPEIRLQYNSAVPFSWNDGPMIPNKGLQSLSTTGFFVKRGIFSMQLRPEWVYAQGQAFMGFPASYSDTLWASRYFWFNEIDQPDRWPANYQAFFPGQSNIKLQYKGVAAGVSSENLWWGPGRHNSLLMTNNAPGFPHLFVRTERPIKSKIGRFEFQFIMGQLQGSGQLPPDTNRRFQGNRLYVPKPLDSRRYLNGVVFVYQPSFVKGLSIGLGRVIYLYTADRQNNFDGFFPIFGFLFKNQTNSEDDKNRDQKLSLYLKQSFFQGNTELYVEYGRNDHAWNFRDLAQNFGNSRGYVLGFNQYAQLKKRRLLFNVELADVTRQAQGFLRPTPNWYMHYQVKHGYTHIGQVIGAGMGPGSRMQSMQFDFFKNASDFYGVGLYRIERNADFFFDAFSPFREQYYRKWVDVALGGKWSHSFKHFNILANAYVVRSFNYQYQDNSNSRFTALKDGIDVLNFSTNLSIQYKLGQ